jgi:hypothetical protein
MRAYPKEDQFYFIVDDRKGESYKIKEQLKALGGKWDGQHWVASESALAQLNIPKMVKAILLPYCCCKEKQSIFVSELELQSKFTRVQCSRCDSSNFIMAGLE